MQLLYTAKPCLVFDYNYSKLTAIGYWLLFEKFKRPPFKNFRVRHCRSLLKPTIHNAQFAHTYIYISEMYGVTLCDSES